MAPFRLPVHRSVARELDEELEFHLEMRTAELVARGWNLEAGRIEARRRLGDLEDARAFCYRADTRRERRLMRVEHFTELRQDVGFAARALRRSPVFTLIAGLTLALGIGANTAIFSVVRGIVLRPLAFADPDRLVLVASTYQGRRFPYASPANAADWKAQSRAFSSLAVFTEHSSVLTGAGVPEELAGAAVSQDFFPTLGVEPVLGRLRFTDLESAWQGPKAVIVNETLWRTRFGADAGLVGRTITLDDVPHLVVGVAPARSVYPEGATLWYPFSVDPALLERTRAAVYLQVIGRLRPGVTVGQADADLRAVSARLERQYPDANVGLGTAVVPLHDWIVGPLDRPLLVLLGSVGFVLLIACANVANLLLVRGVARGKELAVRAALGAGRSRLVRQLMTESLLLAALGAGAGVGLGALGVRLLLGLAPSNLPRLGAVSLDGAVLAFALVLAVATGLIFGLMPARLVTGGDLTGPLRDGGRTASARHGARVGRALVVAEVAMGVVLLAGAGLLIRSFRELTRVDPGFRTERSISFAVSLPDARYPLGGARQIEFMRSLMERLQVVPGVLEAGAAMGMPLTSYAFNFSLQVSGRPTDPAAAPSAEVRVATVDYLKTMGIPILRGRGFTEEDRPGGRRVLLITETAARRLFPNEDPIGRQLRIGWGRQTGTLEGEIVGVAGDVRQRSLAIPPVPQIWVPYEQWPVASVRVVLHTRDDPTSVMNDAGRVVHELDPDLAVAQVTTLDAVVAKSVAGPRFYMVLLTGFALLAVALSAIGIYGVIAHRVGQRSREIGIRMALGASRNRILRMVVAEGAMLAALGLLIGTAGALALGRLLTVLLFEIRPTDPVTHVAVAMALGATAVAASWIPARNAARVDPAVTVRAE